MNHELSPATVQLHLLDTFAHHKSLAGLRYENAFCCEKQIRSLGCPYSNVSAVILSDLIWMNLDELAVIRKSHFCGSSQQNCT